MSERCGLNGGKASDWLRPYAPNWALPILRVEFDYRAPTDEAALSLFGSLLRPYWRESEAQLTEKQVVLLMHDTLPQGIKSVRALLQK